MTERNDRDIWRLIERNPSIAFENEIIAYDILAAEKRRQTDEPIYEGPIGDLLDGPGAFADGLRAAYETARRIVNRDVAAGLDDTVIIDNVLTELAALAGLP